jgi:hypothetical protein
MRYRAVPHETVGIIEVLLLPTASVLHDQQLIRHAQETFIAISMPLAGENREAIPVRQRVERRSRGTARDHHILLLHDQRPLVVGPE